MEDERRLQTIRARFSTWLGDKGFIMTLGLLAQMRFCIDSRLDAPIVISIRADSMTILIRPLTLRIYDVFPDGMFFILMHELRHIPQLPSLSDWAALVNMQSINKVVYERVPELGHRGKSLFQVEDLPGLKNYFVNVAADAALHDTLCD